jgi:hypothetical protein
MAETLKVHIAHRDLSSVAVFLPAPSDTDE